jgi:hypothetical protein
MEKEETHGVGLFLWFQNVNSFIFLYLSVFYIYCTLATKRSIVLCLSIEKTQENEGKQILKAGPGRIAISRSSLLGVPKNPHFYL